MIGGSARLSIRTWLALALIILVAVPALAAWGTYARQQHQQGTQPSSVAAAERLLTAGVRLWGNPKWQAAAQQKLAEQGVDVQLFAADGHEVFANVEKLQKAVAHDGKPSIGAPPGWIGTKLVVSGPGAKKEPRGWAILFYPRLQEQSTWAAPLAVGLVTLLLLLAGIAWFLGQTVVRPLAAMSGAAQQIAAGDLEVRLPASRAGEVAEVVAALKMMSAELKEAGRRQARLEQERRLFIGAIAHDLRTPLFTLRSYLSGLRDGLATTPDRTDHYVAICQEKADALERLIADLFAYARLEYLEQAPQREAIELGALLRGAVDDVEPLATAKGLTLHLHGSKEPTRLAGDEHLLRRAVLNLLDNALRHTPPGGCIRVGWEREETELVFQVEDTGPGIAECDLPHLFTPLYRAEASRNRQTGGAGLGLTVARRILQAHGGDLTAANRAEGGAVFTGRLPLERSSLPSPVTPEGARAFDDVSGERAR